MDVLGSVGSGFPSELARCVTLIMEYDELGLAGLFDKALAEATVRVAVELWESGDPAKQVQAFAMLKGFKINA